MKRPALTRKAINNLIALTGSVRTAASLDAIEWIKRARQWKDEQDKKKMHGHLDPSWVKACKADGVDPLSKFVVFSEDNPEVATWIKED